LPYLSLAYLQHFNFCPLLLFYLLSPLYSAPHYPSFYLLSVSLPFSLSFLPTAPPNPFSPVSAPLSSFTPHRPQGNTIQSAGPSTPVRLLGLRSLPTAGQELLSVANEAKAKQIAERRERTIALKAARYATAHVCGLLEWWCLHSVPCGCRNSCLACLTAVCGVLDQYDTETPSAYNACRT
jgi:hypothetical protein